jgi:hypothetical protein
MIGDVPPVGVIRAVHMMGRPRAMVLMMLTEPLSKEGNQISKANSGVPQIRDRERG